MRHRKTTSSSRPAKSQPVRKSRRVTLPPARQDVTHNKTSDALVQETRAQLDAIIRSAMDAIVTVDHDQRVTLFNEAAEKMFLCSASEVLGQPLDRLLPERFRRAHREHIHTFEQAHVTNRTMGRLGTVFGIRANGEEFPIEASISQVEIGGRKLLTAILRDLTERHRTERKYEESQRFLSTLMSNLPGMVYRCRNDRGWTMEFVSQGCLALTGYSPEDLVRNQVVSFGQHVIHPEDRTRVCNEVQAALELMQPYNLTYRIITAYGEEKWVWEQGRGVFSPDRTLLALEGFIADTTERKRAEERLRQAERLAETGVLASGLAHEIGTPMNVILGRAEYLMERTHDETTQKGLTSIVRQVERITKIMNQLLSFARRRPIEPRPLDLKRTVEDSLEILREKLSKHQVDVEMEFDEPVPLAHADPDQMIQVLLNLLLNSIHAMPDGGKLRIALGKANGGVMMTVADTGHGIPKELQAKIFEPFFTTKEVGKGTGLGLNVVHGIIQDHHGSINVRSEGGQGTTFTITIPACKP